MHLLLFLPSIWWPLFTERVAPQEHYPGCEAPPATSQPQLLLALAPDSLAEVTSCLGVSICTVGIRGCFSPVSWDQQMMSQITVGEALRSQKRLFPEPGPIWLMQGLGFAGNPVRCFRESVTKQGEHRVPTPAATPPPQIAGLRGTWRVCVCEAWLGPGSAFSSSMATGLFMIPSICLPFLSSGSCCFPHW